MLRFVEVLDACSSRQPKASSAAHCAPNAFSAIPCAMALSLPVDLPIFLLSRCTGPDSSPKVSASFALISGLSSPHQIGASNQYQAALFSSSLGVNFVFASASDHQLGLQSSSAKSMTQLRAQCTWPEGGGRIGGCTVLDAVQSPLKAPLLQAIINEAKSESNPTTQVPLFSTIALPETGRNETLTAACSSVVFRSVGARAAGA